jgi:hypothetical protein
MTHRLIPPQDATVVEGSQFEHSFVVKDPEGVRGMSLDDRFYKLGRSPKNDICVRSQLVSREHATLTGVLIEPPLFQIFRLSDGCLEKGKSTNGIKINGERRDHWVLMHGDEIILSSDSTAYYRIEPEPPYVNGKIDVFLDSLKKLAKSYLKSMNCLDVAEATLQQILVLTQQFYGELHPNVADCLIDLAVFYYSKNNFVKVEELFLQAIAIRKEALGEEHPDVTAAILNLAVIYYAKTLYAKAELLFLEVLEIKRKILGSEIEIAANLVDLATIYYFQKRYQEVKNVYEQVLKIYKRSPAAKKANILSVKKNLESIKKKLRPKWLSPSVLIPTSLILLAGVIAYTFFATKKDIACAKVLPNGSTKSMSGDECRKISK